MDEMSFEILPAIIARGKRISILHISFSGEALYAVGILRDLAKLIAEENIPIIKIFSLDSHIIMFIETVDGEKLSKIRDRIKCELRYVENVEIHVSSVEGFASLPNIYPQILGERALILRESAVKSIIESILENLKVTPQIVLYLMGRRLGEEYYETHRRIFHVDLEDMMKIAENLFTATGYGRIEVVKRNLNPIEIEYHIYDCIECKINLESNRRIKSSLIRGLIEGYYTKLLGREVECIEEECITEGKEKCKIRVKPVELK